MDEHDHQTTGIDYGNGIVNVDPVTRIRYGVILANVLLDNWAYESKPFYEYHCPECGAYLKQGYDAKKCPSCKYKMEDYDFSEIDPIAFIYKTRSFHAVQYFDDPDIFVMKSPFFTRCQFCSPCAPGAGYLMTPMKYPHGIKAYCFGHDWFDSGGAPYPVFSVKTNRSVLPEKF